MVMAKTTSAAANMLLSGSTSSGDGMMNPNILARTILPSSWNMATISASAPFPTVTLDLTHDSNYLQLRKLENQFQVPTHHHGNMAQILGQTSTSYSGNQSKFSGLQVSHSHQDQHPSFADTVRATTDVLTANPNLMAALVAAINNIIGAPHPANNNDNRDNLNTNSNNTNK